MKMQKGFTLIELMIVVVIIGLLSAIAMPAYSDYVMRGRLTEATSTLAQAKIAIEQYYADKNPHTYVGYACPASSSFFDYACVGLTTTSYAITATGKNQTLNYNYSIDQDNTKSSNTSWGNNATCWVIRKGGAC